MKILHISRTMGQGGAEKVVYQICKESKNNNMIIASTGGYYEDELKSIGVKHYIIPDIDSKNIINMFKTLFILNKIIRKEKIDIVHSHHRMAAFYSKILSIVNKKIKRVYTAHNVFSNKRFLLRFALKGSRIVAVGNGVRNNLNEFYGISNDKIDIIYNSIEKPKIINMASDSFLLDKNAVFIGNMGRLSEQKGIDVFIRALANIIKENKNVHGVIIGDGDLKEELICLVKDLSLSNNIHFLGFRKDVFELISAMDFLVLSSRWEGFPLTPIEAFSCGKTMIASNISGNNEIIDNNVNGLLFEKDNEVELEEKIKLLLADKNMKQELEKNALDKYIRCYSYESFIEKYNELYSNL